MHRAGQRVGAARVAELPHRVLVGQTGRQERVDDGVEAVPADGAEGDEDAERVGCTGRSSLHVVGEDARGRSPAAVRPPARAGCAGRCRAPSPAAGPSWTGREGGTRSRCRSRELRAARASGSAAVAIAAPVLMAPSNFSLRRIRRSAGIEASVPLRSRGRRTAGSEPAGPPAADGSAGCRTSPTGSRGERPTGLDAQQLGEVAARGADHQRLAAGALDVRSIVSGICCVLHESGEDRCGRFS